MEAQEPATPSRVARRRSILAEFENGPRRPARGREGARRRVLSAGTPTRRSPSTGWTGDGPEGLAPRLDRHRLRADGSLRRVRDDALDERHRLPDSSSATSRRARRAPAVDGAHHVRADDPAVGVRRRASGMLHLNSCRGTTTRCSSRTASGPRERRQVLHLHRGGRPEVRRRQDARAARGGARRARRSASRRRCREPLRSPGRTAASPRARSPAAAGRRARIRPILLERNMYDPSATTPSRTRDFFPITARCATPVEGTIARDRYEDDPEIATGLLADKSGYVMTIPQTYIQRAGGMEKILARGQERFNIYCAPCHGQTGDGKGMVVCKRDKATDPCQSRGFPPLPSTRTRACARCPTGSSSPPSRHGVRTMPAYGPQIPIDDRWAIVAYVRALQLSQMASAARARPNRSPRSEHPPRKRPARRATTGSRRSLVGGRLEALRRRRRRSAWRAAYGYKVDPHALRVLLPLRPLRRPEPRAREPLLRDGPVHHEGRLGGHACGASPRCSCGPCPSSRSSSSRWSAPAAALPVAGRRRRTCEVEPESPRRRATAKAEPPRTRRSPSRVAAEQGARGAARPARTRTASAWSTPRSTRRGGSIAHKRFYLNKRFFLGRLIFYLSVWYWLAQRYFRWSTEQDKTKALENTRRRSASRRAASCSSRSRITFFAFDWFLSLNATWYSTIFGVYRSSRSRPSSSGVPDPDDAGAAAQRPARRPVNVEHYHDLGKLLFGWIVFWSYMSFAQFFLTWYSNIPDEVALFHRAGTTTAGRGKATTLRSSRCTSSCPSGS